MSQSVVPFLKWAGGKRWLIANGNHILPEYSGRHIEPFAGSAALFFALKPKKAILADVNSRLIDTYVAIRDNSELFHRYLKEFATNHSKDYYYSIRSKKFRSKSRSAAQFVYLNRVCFNGIYRENLRGEFNVPLGSKTSVLLGTDDFTATAKLLKGVKLLASDFEVVVDKAVCGDFLYIDPPYTTKHNVNGFIKYNQNIFSWQDQERLALAVKRASERGAIILVSNADHADVKKLYKDFLSISSVARMNVIASKSQHRGKTTEMVATNVC